MTTQDNPVAQNGEGPGVVEPRPNATNSADLHTTPLAVPEPLEIDGGCCEPDGSTMCCWVTVFESVRSKSGKRSGGKFAKWCGRLENAPVAPPDLIKEDLPGFSPATFAGDQRGNDKVEAVYFLVTEHDNEEWVVLDEIDAKTGKKKREKRPISPERRTSLDDSLALWDGISRAAYSSWSHTPEHHKFRILLEVSRAMTAEEHGRIWRWMNARAAEAGHIIDQATSDPSRLWFLPRRREGREYMFRRVDGKPLDVDEILKQVPQEPLTGKPDSNPDTRLAAYVKELEERIDMVALVASDGVELHPHGSVKVAFSPFRDDGNKASFVVYADHAFDFVARKFYGPIQYWREQHGVTFWEALDALAETAGLDKFVRADANKPIPVDPQPRVDSFLSLDPVPVGDERTKLLRAICAEIATQDKSNWPTWTKPLAKKCGVTVGVINAMVREAVKAKVADAVLISDDERYIVENGKLCAVRRVEGGTVNEPLGDFDAWVAEVVTLDDGAERRKVFAIEGKRADGAPLPPVEVRAEDFDAMGWITPAWNGRAVVAAGRGVRDSLRAAIQTRSKPTEATVYGDLGWHVLDDDRVYLHAGGAVGGHSDIRVNVPDELSRFTLPDDIDPDPRDPEWEVLKLAVRRSMTFLDVAPPEVTYPMYSTIWAAPLLDLIPFDAVVCVIGKTQAMKSSLALECQKHFGPFGHTRDLPLNFESTTTAIELILHAAKDTLVVVDDYYPRRNPREAEKQKVLADKITRSIGNRSTRKRANANIQLRASRPPRGLVLMTCEEDPTPASEGESAAARTFKIVLEKGTVNKKLLTGMQKNGQHALVMRRYVEQLAKASNPVAFAQMQAATRDRLRDLGGLSDRMPDVVASMLTGLQVFFFTVAAVAYDKDILRQKLRQAEEVLVGLARAQDSVAKQQEPDLRYLDTIRDALVAGRAKLVQTKVRLDSTPACREIGWYDAEHVYLFPKETHILVSEVMRAAGEHQPWRLETIYDALVKRGYASPRSEKDHVGTKRGVGGGRHRVIELPRQLFEDVCIEKAAPVEDPVAHQELEDALDQAAQKSLPN